MTVRILSTMSEDVAYTVYEQTNDLPVEKRKIIIQGGAGKATKKGFGDMMTDSEGIPLWTPRGLVTPLKDETFSLLKENPVFKRQLERGFLKLVDDVGSDHDKVAKQTQSMNNDDKSAPLNENNIKKRLGPEARKDPTIAVGADTGYDGNINRVK